MSKKIFYYIAITGLVLSIISIFLPVISYEVKGGKEYKYSIVGLLTDSEEFETNILDDYEGPVVWDITSKITVILVVTFIAGILCSVIGLVTLRAQRPNTWQFILTIIGMIGVAVPSLILIISVTGYGKYFDGKLKFGIAPVITIISMIICIFAVIRRKNKVAEELRKQLEQKGIMWHAGDL